MQRRHVLLSLAASLTATSMLSPGARAASWVETIPGTYNWIDELNWDTTPPNAVGAVANFTTSFGNAATEEMIVIVPGGDGATVGILNIGDSGPSPDSRWRISTNGLGTLVFNNGANPAQINAAKDTGGDQINGHDFIGANPRLDSNLIITVSGAAANQLRISGAISGTGGITKEGSGWLEFSNQSGAPNTYTGGTVINGGRLRYTGGSPDIIVGDVIINNGSTLQNSGGNNNGISDSANINLVNGFFNPGGASDTIGSLEGIGTGSQAGGGTGTITFGANNLDKTYNGTLQGPTSWTKVGTGTQTLGGTDQSAQSLVSGNTVPRNFRVNGGKVFLNKTAGVTSIAQSNLFVGDGSQSGAARPELRLLTSNQIQVHAYLAAPAETTQLTLNSGILNTNGQDETLGTARATNDALVLQGASTLDLGAGDSVLHFGNSSAAAWSGSLEILNWSGSLTGAGTDQIFFGADITGLTNSQLSLITFTNPTGAGPGTYAAKLLANGELLPNIPIEVSGDADGDGDADLDDQGIWAANFTGSLTPGTGPGTFATGDFDGDKDVDLDDQGIWAANFTGSLAPNALASVPEPTSLLAACGLAFPLLSHRRVRRRL